jgi:hypothetical protein
MSNQATKLYQDKNTELSTYIDKLSKVEQQLIEQITSTKDQQEQARHADKFNQCFKQYKCLL